MKITKFFRHYQIRDDKRLFLATQALEGEALDWLVWMEEEGSLESWGDFIQDVIRRFGRNPYDIPTGRLSKLHQDSMSTQEYQKKFENMATKAHGISRAALKEMYIIGLNSELQEKLLIARPKDINEAFSLANMCDELKGQTSRSYKSKYYEGKTYISPYKRP